MSDVSAYSRAKPVNGLSAGVTVTKNTANSITFHLATGGTGTHRVTLETRRPQTVTTKGKVQASLR